MLMLLAADAGGASVDLMETAALMSPCGEETAITLDNNTCILHVCTPPAIAHTHTDTHTREPQLHRDPKSKLQE